MKKTMYGILFGFLALFVGGTAISPAFAQDEGGRGNQNLEYNPSTIGSNEAQGDRLINVIKNAINWVLGILGLIALALCLWAGFKMTTAAGDTKKFDEGKTILTNAGIGLAIIALSWMIVSIVFWIINKAAGVGAAG